MTISNVKNQSKLQITVTGWTTSDNPINSAILQREIAEALQRTVNLMPNIGQSHNVNYDFDSSIKTLYN